ncbi:hypothetical protein L6172_18285 [Thalassospiraceae bacterium SW-3-3]|nr:hypothetical protein L6172_18285 [Thalassospiraceae bacterium SW-3-3]
MSRWEHPGLLLLLGSVCGGIVTAIYLTDFFGFHLPAALLPGSIDSGWGSLIGACVGGMFAFGVFWVQRRCDQKDARRKQVKNVLWCLGTLNAKIILMLDAYSRRQFAEALRPWDESEKYEYTTYDEYELRLARKALFILSEAVSEDCREASRSLSMLEAVWRDSDVATQLFWLRETMQKIAKSYERIYQRTREEGPETLSKDEFASMTSNSAKFALRQRDQLIKLQKAVDEVKSDIEDFY